MDKEEEKFYKELFLEEQKLDDRKLEFFTYSNPFNVALEHISTGHANKIYHGPGPVIIIFKDTPERVL